MPVLDYLALYSKNCKICHYLDTTEPQRFKCHFSKGNTECPASEVRFVVVGKAKSLAQALIKFRADRNSSEEAKILEKVSKASKPFQTRFYEELDALGRNVWPTKTPESKRPSSTLSKSKDT